LIPVLLRIGPIKIYSFGLMAALAFLAGRWILLKGLERRGIPPQQGDAYSWATLVGGIVGAHLYYIVEHWEEVRADPLGSLFSGSGLVWYGGLIGGVVAGLLVVAWKKHRLALVADAFGPTLTIVYALGRVGCFLAGDGDYGPPSDLPWAMAFPNGTVPTTERVHPTPLYEVLAILGVFLLLRRLERREPKPGTVFWAYILLAGLERFLAEFVRRTPEVALGLTMAQWISMGGMLVALVALRALYLRPAGR
jgi:phosphatidylglycerol:prolipoprotein diacylglycerol transferase